MQKYFYPRITKFLLGAAIFSTFITVALVVFNYEAMLTHINIVIDHAKYYNPTNNLAQQLSLNDILRRDLIEVVLGFSTSVFFWFAYFVRQDFFDGKSLWEESVGMSVIFASSAFLVCYCSILYDNNKDMDLIINAEKDLNHFKIKRIQISQKVKETPPLFIPTGIYLQSIEFTNSNNCILTAYIWQKYENGFHDSLTRGFLLPEAQEAEITENYRKKVGNTEIIGWTVKATIREVFHFRDYPFDHQNFWLRLWHKDFDKNVILIPDIQAYTDYKPNKLPGIEKFIVLPSWYITHSFFGYKYNSYNTNFGINDYVGLQNFPELYYNVFIQRDFVSVFISDLVPIVMTIAILFIALIVTYKPEETTDDVFKFNVMEIISLVAALIFVVLLAHIELRSRIVTETVVYIEYYYFLTYAAIFCVLGNYLILHKQYNIPFILAKNNYYPKILFLPLLTLFMLLLTIFVFY